MSESSVIKDALYAEIERIGQDKINELLLKREFSVIFENIFESAIDKINEDFKNNWPNMNDEEKMRWKFQRYMQDYLGTISSIDDNVGRVLDYLDETGLDDNTIVIYTSDQGFYLGEHGWFDKRFIYDESFKTPVMIKWPNKIKPGITNDEMVQNLDFAQTFLEAAMIDVPDDMQ